MKNNYEDLPDRKKLTSAMIEIYKFFHLSGKQSCVIFDISISTWNRIKKGMFYGNFTQDQKFRISNMNKLKNTIKERKIDANWLFIRIKSKEFNKTPFDIISASGLFGIVILTHILQGKNLSLLQR